MTDLASMVGREVHYRVVAPNEKLVEVDGTIVDWRLTGTMIWDPISDQQWPGVQFQIETEGGKRFWTVTYPDKGDGL